MIVPVPLRVVLFGLTGYGNAVLNALLADTRVVVPAVFTHKYDNPFPYYRQESMIDHCASEGIPCHHGVSVSSNDGVAMLRGYDPDLVIVAAFRQIIRPVVFPVPRLGIVNVHPSLLPRYRGVCPTNHTVLNGDRESGVSIHYLVEDVDAGNILLQRRIPVDNAETDSSLRKKTADLAAAMIPDLIGLCTAGRPPAGRPQDLSKGSLAPRPAPEEGYLEECADIVHADRAVRALNPFPGTSVLAGKRRVDVDAVEPLPGPGPDGIVEGSTHIDVRIKGKGVRYRKRPGS